MTYIPWALRGTCGDLGNFESSSCYKNKSKMINNSKLKISLID